MPIGNLGIPEHLDLASRARLDLRGLWWSCDTHQPINRNRRPVCPIPHARRDPHSFRNRWQYLNNDNDNEQSNGSHVIYSEYQVHTTGEQWGIEGLNLTTGLVNMVALSRAELYSGGSSDGINSASNRAAYIQVDQSLGERVKLAGGARYEHFSVNGTGAGKPVFRLGANYQVAEATFLAAVSAKDSDSPPSPNVISAQASEPCRFIRMRSFDLNFHGRQK